MNISVKSVKEHFRLGKRGAGKQKETSKSKAPPLSPPPQLYHHLSLSLLPREINLNPKAEISIKTVSRSIFTKQLSLARCLPLCLPVYSTFETLNKRTQRKSRERERGRAGNPSFSVVDLFLLFLLFLSLSLSLYTYIFSHLYISFP